MGGIGRGIGKNAERDVKVVQDRGVFEVFGFFPRLKQRDDNEARRGFDEVEQRDKALSIELKNGTIVHGTITG
ncbi:hypothetical protein IFM89_034560 [Coptis chinensis]|uniref:Uncharacterized protein n=1 Tax=Coptis chinensis TaxID=261450 RepID=A0A835HRQ8_9MAGN|nr:hypothetical protein IFM89_034560 [Coptis chinensis]